LGRWPAAPKEAEPKGTRMRQAGSTSSRRDRGSWVTKKWLGNGSFLQSLYQTGSTEWAQKVHIKEIDTTRIRIRIVAPKPRDTEHNGVASQPADVKGEELDMHAHDEHDRRFKASPSCMTSPEVMSEPSMSKSGHGRSLDERVMECWQVKCSLMNELMEVYFFCFFRVRTTL
jgi:hypothetical protein